MRTLHFGLRVIDLDRSLAFYTAFTSLGCHRRLLDDRNRPSQDGRALWLNRH